MTEDKGLLNHLLRHLVPLLFVCRKDDKERSFIVTAFAFSVGDRWLLVTAGHCLHSVDDLINKEGYRITECSLIDFFGSQARSKIPIPFTYSQSRATFLGDYLDTDYGLIPLSRYYRQLIESNGIQPLSEEVWLKQPPAFESYMMLGVPWELSDVRPDVTTATAVLIPVERLEERPPEAPSTEFPIFYGRIPLDQTLTDIEGMSGGPIFGFAQDSETRTRYWLVALQSHWVQAKKTILAAPTGVLGRFLLEHMASAEEEGAA